MKQKLQEKNKKEKLPLGQISFNQNIESTDRKPQRKREQKIQDPYETYKVFNEANNI